ncbi:hypothetical protein THO17_21330 [Marinomonas sp. THO17]
MGVSAVGEIIHRGAQQNNFIVQLAFRKLEVIIGCCHSIYLSLVLNRV